MPRRPGRALALLAAAFLTLPTTTLAGANQATAAAEAAPTACAEPLTRDNRPVAPPDTTDELASFIDPTAVVIGGAHVKVSHRDYVAPFATLIARSAKEGICIEEGSNVQDNTLLAANGGMIRVGEGAIVAHGAMLVGRRGPVGIAHQDACPLPASGVDPNTIADPAEAGRQALANALAEAGASYDCDKVPAFIGFNALSHSEIEDGALLGVSSRLQKGVVLRAGYSSYPGKSLNTQAEADTPGADPAAFKVRFVTAGDIVFMRAVLHVNECLAHGYTAMYRDAAGAVHPDGGPDSIRGISIDPGAYHGCEFNHSSERPTIAGVPTSDPSPDENIRIIGDAHVDDLAGISDFTSIRADEGEPIDFGAGVRWGFGTTFHSLEPEAEDPERGVIIEDGVEIGAKVVIHGGGRRTRIGGFGDEPTEIHAGSVIGPWAVIFRSDLAFNTEVGYKAVVVGWTNERPGGVITELVIPDRCVKFDDTPTGECAYFVEW